MAQEIISYLDARAKGLKRYFTGNPCSHGHLSERFVSNCGCIQCAYDRTNRWGAENAHKKRANFINFITKNPQYRGSWAANNPHSIRKSKRKWYIENAEHQVKRALDWAKKNPEKSRTNVRNRSARRKKAQGSHTTEQIIKMLENQRWLCAAC